MNRLLLPIATSLLAGLASAQLPRLVVETDFGGDTDDAALVAFAHRLADEGLVHFAAVMHNGNNEWGAAAISAVNAYYGRPTLPIGTYRTAAEAGRPEYHPLVDPSNPSLGRVPLSYIGPTLEGQWVRMLAENYPSRYAGRLAFPDAVEVYRHVVANAPDDSVVIVNGGHHGNLSNLVAWLEHDPAFLADFQRAVSRVQIEVGGVNTCVATMFPNGVTEHVFNNTRIHTATATWLGPPQLGGIAVETEASMATEMALDHPVREAYRFKKEVEHGHRHTSLAWRWHVIDISTAFSVLGHDWVDPTGIPYFSPRAPEWIDVIDNCTANYVSGVPANPLHEFESVRLNQLPGETVDDASQRLRQRFFEDGIYVPPATKGSPERDHFAITAMFEDGTYGGLDPIVQPAGVTFQNQRLSVPLATSGMSLLTEGRRYFDQTAVIRFRGMPQLDQHPASSTHQVYVDYAFWGDSRFSTHMGVAPTIRVVGWPGRGWGSPPSQGQPVYRVELWEVRGGVNTRVAWNDLQNTAAGEPFWMRVRVEGSTVECFVEDEAAFDQPVVLQSAPPFDGGYSSLLLHGDGPASETFELDYVLIRPDAGGDTIPDVHVDKVGNVWLSYVKNGDVIDDLIHSEGGRSNHFVDVAFGNNPTPLRIGWNDQDPTTVNWVDVLVASGWRGVRTDHFVYVLPALPWMNGDSVVLEYRGRREGETIVRF